MGISLADVGLFSRGMRSAAAEFEAAKAREEDRLYQLERRRMEQERALAEQEERRRQAAYQNELRALLPQFLASGEGAIPAQAAVPAGEPLDAYEVVQGAVARAAQPAREAQPNPQGMYEAIQALAAKHGRLSDYEATKQRLEKYQEEGVLDFIRKARQGAGDEELVETFNKSGKVKLSGLRKVNDDEYVGVTAEGKPVSLNLTRMTESLLGPKDLLTHKDKTAERERKARDAEARAEVAAKNAEATGKLREAQIEAARARAERDRAKAGENPSGRRPGNWNQYDNQVKSLATSYLTSPDPDTGKPMVDRKNVAKLTSMASAIARREPELSPAEALERAVEKFEEVRGIQERGMDQAAQEASGLTFQDSEARRKWVEDRAKRLSTMRATEPAARAPARAERPKPAAGPKPGSVIDGYRFKGGDPNDEKNWEKV